MIQDDNSTAGASSAWADIAQETYARRGDELLSDGSARTITVRVRRLPENVYLAVGDNISGMTVEAKTLDQIIEESKEVAMNLLELSGEDIENCQCNFVFIFYD